MTKPSLHLHVGYGKTGSTALQHSLASQQESLLKAGVLYPLSHLGVGDSGNGALLLEALSDPQHQPSWLCSDGQHTSKRVLFSREQLARELSEPGACSQLTQWARVSGFGPVHVLLYVRDPQEHCYSLWAQKVKRAGESRSLCRFAEDYDAISMAARFLSAALAEHWRVTVLDYGRHRRGLWEALLGWLELPQQQTIAALAAAAPRLNPTPSHGQLRLQRRLHRLWPGGRAPLPPGWLAPSRSMLRFEDPLLRRWEAQVADFNRLLPACSPGSEPMPFQPGILLNQRGIRLLEVRP